MELAMMDNTQIMTELTDLEGAFNELDTRRISIEERINKHDRFINRLRMTSSTDDILRDSKTQKHGEQIVDNPLYLMEIRDFLKDVIDEIVGLKIIVDKEKKEAETIITSYKIDRCIAACFSALERLELDDLDQKISVLKRLAPKNELVKVFQDDLKSIENIHGNVSDEKWQQLKKFGAAVNSGLQLSEKQKQLMILIADHQNISIFSQWYQLCRLSLLQGKRHELVRWEKLYALNTVIQEASRRHFKGGVDEEKLWEIIRDLEEGFADESFLASLGDGDEVLKKQWLGALEMTKNQIIASEVEKRMSSKKRKEREKQWNEYFGARRDILLNTAGKDETHYLGPGA